MKRKESILEKHVPNIDPTKVEQAGTVKCVYCGSLNTEIKPTNSGGTKLICNNCFHKEKSVNYFRVIGVIATLIGVLVISYLI